MDGAPVMGESSARAAHEIEHGSRLARGDAELTWGWATAAGRRRAKRRAQLIVDGARLAPGVEALEIGCGTGLFTEMFAATGARIVAIDISNQLLDRARARGLPADRVVWLERRVEDCRLDDPEFRARIGRPFDAVVGSSVLHHLDVGPALDRIFRLIAPGGWISFAEPNMLNPQVFAERTFRRAFPYVSEDETAFVRWRLDRTLRAFGFDRICIVPFDWLHPSTPPALITVVERCGRLAERLPGVREFSGSVLICARRPL